MLFEYVFVLESIIWGHLFLRAFVDYRIRFYKLKENIKK